jgi:hypothetical protein
VTKQPQYLRETIPAGPGAWPLAERTLTRYPNQVNERRNPRTSSTVTQLLTATSISGTASEPH